MAIEITKQEGTGYVDERRRRSLSHGRSQRGRWCEGDSRAAWLLVAHGGQIPIDEAEKYGLTGDQGSTAPTDEPTDAKAKQPRQTTRLKAAPTNKAK
jgi:hypothetical protein